MAKVRRRKKVAKKRPAKRKWRELDLDAAQKHQEERESRKDSVFHELEVGWNYFFILPPWSSENMIWKEVQQHEWGLNCPKALSKGKKSCSMCVEFRKRQKRGDTDFTDRYKLSSRGLFNAIRKEHIRKALPEHVKVLGTSNRTFGDIVEHVTDERVNIARPDAAYLVGIKRTGKGKHDTRYKVRVASEPTDISMYLTDEILEGLFDLDSIRAAQPAGAQELRKALRGGSAADDDDGDDFSAGTGFDDDDDGDDFEDGDESGGDDDDLFDDPDAEEEQAAEEEEGGEEEEGEEEEGEEEEEGDDWLEEEEEEEEPEPPPRRRKKRRKKKVAKKPVSKKAKKKGRRRSKPEEFADDPLPF